MEYSLIKRLHELSIENESAKKLYATWTLNRPLFVKALSTVNYNFPHYSMHEESHSISIIEKIEQILDDNRIKVLGYTDIWLILMAAYLHDIGMSISNDILTESWKDNDFQEYLIETSLENDSDLCSAASYILKLQHLISSKDSGDDIFGKDWPLKVRNCCILLVANYFRKSHANMSKKWIDKNSKEEGNFITGQQLIPERLLMLLGEIVWTHQLDFSSVMELPFRCNGLGTDIVHPRFIACMLRIGDLLDLDNGRFDPFWEQVSGVLPASSEIHKKKHASIKHFFVNAEMIELSADCENEMIYREMRSWGNWLKDEIRSLASFWLDIVPKKFEGAPPILKPIKLRLKGTEGKDEQVDLRFEISQEKAFEIIEGAGIYNDKLIFLREIIQNAIDASKIQLWQDIMDDIYVGIDKGSSNINDIKFPNDIPREIWSSYPIKVKIEMIDENKFVRVSVEDHGCGISEEDLYSIAHIGRTSPNKQKENIIKTMPFWLKPTGAFGLGLQSIFLVNNRFIVETKAYNEKKCKKISFVSRKQSGYITINDNDKKMNRGTNIIIDIPTNIINNPVPQEYDCFTSAKEVKYLLIVKNCIKNMLLESTFDIMVDVLQNKDLVYTKNGAYKKIDELIEKNPIKNYNDKFRYIIESDEKKGFKVHFWENIIGSYIVFQPKRNWTDFKKNNGPTRIAFRGVTIANRFNLLNAESWYGSLECDLLKPDTKDTLTIDRKTINNDMKKNIMLQLKKQIFPIVTEICLEYFIKNIDTQKWLIDPFFSMLLLAKSNNQIEIFNQYKAKFVTLPPAEICFGKSIILKLDGSLIPLKDFFSLKNIWAYYSEKRRDDAYEVVMNEYKDVYPDLFNNIDAIIKYNNGLGEYLQNNYTQVLIDHCHGNIEYTGQFHCLGKSDVTEKIGIESSPEKSMIEIRNLWRENSTVRGTIKPINPYGKILAVNEFPKDFMRKPSGYRIISPFCMKNQKMCEGIKETIKKYFYKNWDGPETERILNIQKLIEDNIDQFLLSEVVSWVAKCRQIDKGIVIKGYIELMAYYYMNQIMYENTNNCSITDANKN